MNNEAPKQERPLKGKRLQWLPRKCEQPLRLDNPSHGVRVPDEELAQLQRLTTAPLVP